MAVDDHLHGPCTPVYTIRTRRERPCTRAVKTAVFTVHGRVRAAYMAVIASRTDHVRGPCTAVYTVCTWPWAAVYMGRKHGRLHGGKYGRVHGHGRTMYITRARPCTVCTRPWAAVYRLCTRPYTGHAHGPSVSRTRPCTQPERGKTRPGMRTVPDRVRTVYMAVHGPCTMYTAVFTARVHGRVRTMYTAVHGPSMTRTWPCTRSCTLYTAVFTTRVQYTARKRPCTADGHGRVYGPCTRPCTVYMHVFVACVYGRPQPCTDCVRAMYMVHS